MLRWETLRSLVAFAALANGRLRRLAVRRKLEDARYTAAAGAGATPTAAAGTVDTPPASKPNPNLKQRPPRASFCLKLDNYCSYARYSCGNNCNVVVKLVQECKFLNAFYFRSTETVHRERYVFTEANGYKRALALRNTRLLHQLTANFRP